MPWFKGTINNRLRSTDSVDVAERMNPEALSIAINAGAVTTATVERLTAQMDALRKEAEMKDRQIQFSNQERDAAAATAAKYAHITENALRDRNVLLRAHAAMDADLLATQEAMLLQGAELDAAKAEMEELKDFKDQTDRLASGEGWADLRREYKVMHETSELTFNLEGIERLCVPAGLEAEYVIIHPTLPITSFFL